MYVIEPLLIRLIIYLIGYLIVIFIGASLIGKILEKYGFSFENEEIEIPGAGKLIGILERILVLTFMYINEPSAISMIFAAKSIIRFQTISRERSFAEYYLIGTLLSITFALIIGVIIFYIVNNSMNIILSLLNVP